MNLHFNIVVDCLSPEKDCRERWVWGNFGHTSIEKSAESDVAVRERGTKQSFAVCILSGNAFSHDKKMSIYSQEFEVLAQIRLLQSSCKNCIFKMDEDFIRWYQSVPTLTEEER